MERFAHELRCERGRRETPLLRRVFAESSVGALAVDPELERGLESRAYRRIATKRVPWSVRAIEKRQRQDAFHDPGVVGLIFLEIAPDGNVDESAPRAAQRDAIGNAVEIRQIVRQVELFVAKVVDGKV